MNRIKAWTPETVSRVLAPPWMCPPMPIISAALRTAIFSIVVMFDATWSTDRNRSRNNRERSQTAFVSALSIKPRRTPDSPPGCRFLRIPWVPMVRSSPACPGTSESAVCPVTASAMIPAAASEISQVYGGLASRFPSRMPRNGR